MQRDSTKLRDVEQLPLIPDRRITSRPVSLEHIRLLGSTKAALEYACQLADVAPKEVYGRMDCDKSTWSRICSGEWDLDGRDVLKFCRVVNNDTYLLYLIHVHGYDLTALRMVRDDKERRIAELETENQDLRRAMRLVWAEALKGRGP